MLGLAPETAKSTNKWAPLRWKHTINWGYEKQIKEYFGEILWKRWYLNVKLKNFEFPCQWYFRFCAIEARKI